MIENQIEKTMNSNNLRIYVGIPRLTSIDWKNSWEGKTIEIENNTCDWKTIEIENNTCNWKTIEIESKSCDWI